MTPQVRMLIHRLDPDLEMPCYEHHGDAGLDLRARHDVCLGPGERGLVTTGIALALPPGYAAFIHARSGLALRCGLGVVNGPGVIDASYRGEIGVILINHDRHSQVQLSRGDRIAQLVIQRVAHAGIDEVASLPGSQRGDGGFGSTGGHTASLNNQSTVAQ